MQFKVGQIIGLKVDSNTKQINFQLPFSTASGIIKNFVIASAQDERRILVFNEINFSNVNNFMLHKDSCFSFKIDKEHLGKFLLNAYINVCAIGKVKCLKCFKGK